MNTLQNNISEHPNNRPTNIHRLIKGMTLATLVTAMSACEYGFEGHDHGSETHATHTETDPHDHANSPAEKSVLTSAPDFSEVALSVRELIDTALIASVCGNGTAKSVQAGTGPFSFPPGNFTKVSDTIVCKNPNNLIISNAAYGETLGQEFTLLQTITKTSPFGYVGLQHSFNGKNLFIRQTDQTKIAKNGALMEYSRSIDMYGQPDKKCIMKVRVYNNPASTFTVGNCTPYITATAQKMDQGWNGSLVPAHEERDPEHKH